MFAFNALQFKDHGLEASFRSSWDDRSRSLVLLLSLLTGIIWAVGWMNIMAHCHWSRLLCGAAQLASASMVALQVCVQWTLRMHPHWRIPERNKAFVLCADLAAAMAYIILVRDLEEVPGGTHDWMISCHGWGILFLQATSASAINLHTINILCYALIEGYLWLEFGEAAFMRGGVTHALLMLLLCSALPLAANVAEEVQSRRAFLTRHRQYSPTRREWLFSL